MTDKTTHDLIIEELRAYFEAHLAWEAKNTHTAATKARAALSEVRRLCRIRRDEIQEIRKQKPKAAYTFTDEQRENLANRRK